MFPFWLPQGCTPTKGGSNATMPRQTKPKWLPDVRLLCPNELPTLKLQKELVGFIEVTFSKHDPQHIFENVCVPRSFQLEVKTSK